MKWKRRHRDLATRFWALVEKSAGCWLWKGGRVPAGYGIFGISFRVQSYAHRFSYELCIGPIPDGLFVLHSCDNPPCVNPEHLWVGTMQDNHDDMIAKGRMLRGSQRPLAKLDEQKVKLIKDAIAAGMELKLISEEFHVSASTISKIKRGLIWKHV